MNQHQVDLWAARLRGHLKQDTESRWPQDSVEAFVGYVDAPDLEHLMSASLYRRRVAVFEKFLAAHLDAAAPAVRRDCMSLLDVVVTAPVSLAERVLRAPALEKWLGGKPTDVSAAGLTGFLAGAHLSCAVEVPEWSAQAFPVHLGEVVVHQDGPARVDGRSDGRVRIHGAAGEIEVGRAEQPGGRLRVDGTGAAAAAVLPKSARGDLVLDGHDPRLRDMDLPTEPIDGTTPRAVVWTTLVDAGFVLLDHIEPRAAAQVRRTLRVLVPYRQLDGRKFGLKEREMISSTAGNSVGAFGISLGDEDPLQIAEALVHEHAHTRLRPFLWENPLHGADGLTYDAAWRRDPRPISGLVQGIAAFTLVCQFYKRVRVVAAEGQWPTSDPPEESALEATANRRRDEVLHAIRQATSGGELLPLGHRFMERATEVLLRAPATTVTTRHD